MFELKISAEAFADLEKIWVFTFEKWSKEQADTYYMCLIDQMNFLKSNFHTGKSVDYICIGYRVSFVKSHVIFYKLGEDLKIEIIRILHQSVNIEDWLM